MRSVLMGIKDNATLTIEVSDNFVGQDPVTGNPIIGKSTIQIRAFLEQSDKPSRDADRPQQGNASTTWMVGKACDPALLPPGIPPRTECRAVIDLPNLGTQEGTFYLYFKAPSAAQTRLKVAHISGQNIQGWFVPD